MTIEEINNLSVDQLQEMAGHSLSLEQLVSYREELIAQSNQYLEIRSRLDAIGDWKHAFHNVHPSISNSDLWLKKLLDERFSEADGEIAALEVKGAELKAEKDAREVAENEKKNTIAAFKSNQNPQLPDIIEVVKILLEQ